MNKRGKEYPICFAPSYYLSLLVSSSPILSSYSDLYVVRVSERERRRRRREEEKRGLSV
jgi:hypothetical protein